MSSTQALIDSLTRRQIFVQRYSKGEAARLFKRLKRLSKLIKSEIGTDFNRLEAEVIIRNVSRMSEVLLKSFGKDLVKGATDFAKAEAEFIQDSLKFATTATTFSAPTMQQYKSMFTTAPMKLINGKKITAFSVDSVIKQFSENKVDDIARIIRDGALAGHGSAKISKQIFELVEGRTKAQTESLVRTITNHVGSQAREATFAANSDIIDKIEFVAVLDDRTTITCASFDGQFFAIGEEPIPPLHWGCRSIRVPVVKPEFDIGSELHGERSTPTGQIGAKTTFGGWLKGQPLEVRQEILGRDREKLFRIGGLPMEKFTDKRGRIYSLKDLKRLNPLVFQRLPAKIVIPTAIVKKDPVIKPTTTEKVIEETVTDENFTNTVTAKWNIPASVGSRPEFIRIMKEHQDVTITAVPKKGAYAVGGYNVNMPRSYSPSNPYNRNTWRHEMGHIIDVNIGRLRGGTYISSFPAFKGAMAADVKVMKMTQGKGRASKARDALLKAKYKDQTHFAWKIGDIEDPRVRINALEEFAENAGFNFQKFDSWIRTETVFYQSGEDLAQIHERMAKVLVSMKHKAPHNFVDAMSKGWSDKVLDPRMFNLANEKTGALASFSDLIGSSSKNVVLDHHARYYGHTTAYLKKYRHRPATESFANLNALFGNKNKYWWDTIAKTFAPEMAKTYENIIK